MQTKTAIELCRYWDDARGSKVVPDRSQIEPGQIRHILPDLFILEKTSAGDIRFRLAGTRICSFFARELRGSRFEALWAGQQISRLARISEEVMARKTPTGLTAQASTGRADRLGVELVLLPMRSVDGAVDRIIGAMVPEARPVWLDASPANFLDLETVQPIDERAYRPAPADRPRLDPHPAVRDLRPGAAIRRVLHLRVLDGGKHT